MAIFLWILGFIAAYFVITFGIHLYKMKTDPYYRFKAQEEVEEKQVNKKIAELMKSKNPKVKELTDAFFGKQR